MRATAQVRILKQEEKTSKTWPSKWAFFLQKKWLSKNKTKQNPKNKTLFLRVSRAGEWRDWTSSWILIISSACILSFTPRFPSTFESVCLAQRKVGSKPSSSSFLEVAVATSVSRIVTVAFYFGPSKSVPFFRSGFNPGLVLTFTFIPSGPLLSYFFLAPIYRL